MCLHFKYWLNCQKCSDLGCCPSIRASLRINRYFGAMVGPAKLERLSQMHAVCVSLFMFFLFIMETSLTQGDLRIFPIRVLVLMWAQQVRF